MPPKRCPYSDCQKEFDGRLSRHVHLCPVCRRLSIECENKGCGCLNRPYMLFCRRCQDDMLDRGWTGTSEELWQQASRASLETDATGEEADEAGERGSLRIRSVGAAGPPETVFVLSELHAYERHPSMLAMSFIKGLLAIHQAGGALALVHPFSGAPNPPGTEATPHTVLFEAKDPTKYRRTCRPFAPQEMSDHRHIVFATASSVYAVNVWSLRDWACREERPRHFQVVDCCETGAPQLTTAPIPLGGSVLGLISSAGGGEYLWTTLDLKQVADNGRIENLAAVSRRLPVGGDSCQAELVGKNHVAIYSPQGHWVWRVGDAQASDCSKLKQTLDPGTRRLLMHRHDGDPNEFRSLRHFRFLPKSAHRAATAFTWYYKHEDRPYDPLWCYDVDLQTLKSTRSTPLDDRIGTVPLGDHQDSGGLRRVVFCRGKKLCVDKGLRLEDLPEQGQIEDVEQESGFVFADPLLGTLGANHSAHAPSPWQLTVRSINHANWHLTVDLPKLLSDPLIWSRWLFTVELGQDRQSMLLNRRDLFASLFETAHPEPATETR